MANIGINNQYTPVSRPSIVRMKMNHGVDSGDGTQPSVQFGTAERGCSLSIKPLTTYNLPKPGGADGAPPQPPSGPRLVSLGGLNAANGGQLGNKAVFNLYEMVALMITLSNALTKTFREQMAARVVGEISKLHDEARTLTNAAYTARTMGIVSAAAGGALGTLTLGGTLATGVASKGASAASGLDAASKNLDIANREMKPLQDFTKAQGDLNSRSADVLDQALKQTFNGNEGQLQGGDIASQLEQKTKDIRAFEDNQKTIGELENKLQVDNEVKQQAPNKVENKGAGEEEEIVKNNNINNENNVENKPDNEVKNEELPGLSQEERTQIENDIKSLKETNVELDKKYGIRENYGNKPSEAYRNELHDRFDGTYQEPKPGEDNLDELNMSMIKEEDLEIKPVGVEQKGFNAEVDGAAALKGHPFDRKAVKEAGAKWLERQDAILNGGTDQIKGGYAQAKLEFGRSQDIYKGMMEGSKAVSFTQAAAGMGQGMIPVLQLLTSGAGVNELASAQTKDLQAGERADSFNVSEMQDMRGALKGIVDMALQVMSTAVSSFAQFQNTVNSNFRA